MPGSSQEQHRIGQDQEDQENQEDQEEEEQKDQENQDSGHEDHELQGEMGRPVSPLWSSTPEYYFMLRHVVAGSFTGEQAHRWKRARKRFQMGHRRNTLRAMEYSRQMYIWEEKQASQNAAIYRPWDAPTPPPSPPTSEFEQMMWPHEKQCGLAENEHKVIKVEAVEDASLVCSEASEVASPVCSGVQGSITHMQSQRISAPQTQPMDLSVIRVANSSQDHTIYPVIKQGHGGSCLENTDRGLAGSQAPAPNGARQFTQGVTRPAPQRPQRPSCIIHKSTPEASESALMVKHTGIIQTLTSTTMASTAMKASASSLPVPLVAMFLKGSRQGEAIRIHVTPDTGASSTVISAHTAKVLLLQIDETRKVNLEDAQGNQLEVAGIASLYGCLEIAQEFWGNFEVIVSPALSTGVLLSHVEQKFFGILHPQWPNICLHQHQSTPKHHRMHSDNQNLSQTNLFQTNYQHGRKRTFKTSLVDLPKELRSQVDSCPGGAELPTDTPSSSSSMLKEFSSSFVSKLEPNMRVRGAPMKIILKENFTPHKVFKARPIPFHPYGKAKALYWEYIQAGVITELLPGETNLFLSAAICPERVESPPVAKLAMKAKVDIAKTKPVEETAEAVPPSAGAGGPMFGHRG